MSEPITRLEFNESISRIHQRVDDIAKTTIQIETSAGKVEKSVDKICECVYGNGRDGLSSKIVRLFERVSLQTKLILLIMGSILALAFYIIRESLAR